MISFTIDMLGWTPNKGVTNHRLDRPSQSAPAQSGAWGARQAIP